MGVFLLLVAVGLLVYKAWPLLKALSTNYTHFNSQAKADGFTFIYSGGVALHPDGILRTMETETTHTDYPKSMIETIRRVNNTIGIHTRSMDEPYIELHLGYQANDFYNRLRAMIS